MKIHGWRNFLLSWLIILLQSYNKAGIYMNIVIATTSFLVQFQQINFFMALLLKWKEALLMRLILQGIEVLRREKKVKDISQVPKSKIFLCLKDFQCTFYKESINWSVFWYNCGSINK